MLRLCGWIAGVCVGMTFLSTGCKQKDAQTMAASKGAPTTAAASNQYEWCRASPAAWQGLIDAIDRMEKSERSGTASVAAQAIPASLPASAAQLLSNPPLTEPPPCGEAYDQAILSSKELTQAASDKQSGGGVTAGFGGCEMQNSSGIMSITKLSSGHYRIELLGCGGRQRSEMIVSPQQLKGLAGTLLRGV